jgi:Protein of unknown function (DUF4199)
MNNPSIKFGIYGAVAIMIIDLLLALVSPELYISISSWLALPIIIIAMVLVSKEYIASNEGVASLGELFKANWLSYLIMGLITSIFGYILVKYISPEIQEITVEKALEAMEKMKSFMPAEAAEQAMADMESKDPFSLGTQLIGIIVKYAMAAVPAVIIAAIMKKEKSPFA